jgi:NitT/TauT family transport system substrate-binding protein
MPRRLTSAVLVVLLTALAACAGATTSPSASLKKVSIVLQWVAQGQFAGYYVAAAKGFYSDVGLDVTVKPGGPDIVPAQVVAAGQSEFGEAPLVNILQAREAGTKAVVLASVIQTPPNLLVSFKKAGIVQPTDLRGKKLGSWGVGSDATEFVLLKKAGLDPEKDLTIVKQGFDMTQLLNGDVDAAQANRYNEYAQLLETVNPDTGKLFQPGDLNVISMADQGVHMVQDSIFSSEGFLSQAGNEKLAQDFVEASLKGWIYCRDHEDECVQIVLAAGTALGQSHQAWMVNETLKLIFPAPNGVGVLNSTDLYGTTVDIAKTYDLLKADPDTAAARYEVAQKAVDALKADGTDVVGASWQPVSVTLQPGGK